MFTSLCFILLVSQVVVSPFNQAVAFFLVDCFACLIAGQARDLLQNSVPVKYVHATCTELLGEPPMALDKCASRLKVVMHQV